MNHSQKMLEVFVGNRSSFGRSVPKDGDPRAGGMRVDEQLTEEVMRAHLRGTQECGMYPTWHDERGVLMAGFGCCDIDTNAQAWEETFALATALKAMGMTPHIEKSRSKGFHCWIFPEQPVTALEMRRSLKVAYAAIELPAKEANPKSETLKPGQVGNYVRVPYFDGGTEFGNQRFFTGWDSSGPGVPLGLDDWLYEFDTSSQTSPDVIKKWAYKWREPERAEVSVRTYGDQELQELCGSLRGDLLLFVKNGPRNDRSAGMVALAHKLRGAKYTATEAFNVLCVADSQWGSKYESRGVALRDKYVTEIIERVYA